MRKPFLTLLAALLLPIQSACADEYGYQVSEIAEGVFYHQGVHEDASEHNIGAIANVGFIVGDNCVAVIDSGGSHTEGLRLHEAIRAHSDKPVCYVINTHVHPDHTLGNAAFLAETPVYVGHEKLPAAMDAREPYYRQNFADILGAAFDAAAFIRPEKIVAVDTPVTLDLGNRELVLTAYSTAHTDHDLTVFDTATKTLWTGDLLFIKRIPAIDGSINGWINAIDVLQQIDADIVIPGHGPAARRHEQQPWQAQLRYLSTIRTQVRDIINDMGTIEEATQTVGLDEKDNWALFDLYHRRNVTASFVELEWE